MSATAEHLLMLNVNILSSLLIIIIIVNIVLLVAYTLQIKIVCHQSPEPSVYRQ